VQKLLDSGQYSTFLSKKYDSSETIIMLKSNVSFSKTMYVASKNYTKMITKSKIEKLPFLPITAKCNAMSPEKKCRKKEEIKSESKIT
jgi:hypothetical protein